MKRILSTTICLLSSILAVEAQSYVLNPSNNSRIYKWERQYLLN